MVIMVIINTMDILEIINIMEKVTTKAGAAIAEGVVKGLIGGGN